MFCKNCGTQLADDAKFCANCGTPVTSSDAPQAPDASIDDPIKFPGAGFPGDDVPAPEAPAPEIPVSEAPAPEAEAPVSEPSAPAEEPSAPQDSAPAADSSLPVSAPASTLTYAPADAGSSAGASPVKRRGKAGLVVLGVGAVVVIAVIALLVNLLGGLFSGGGKAAYAYRNDDGELMYLSDLNEKTKALELTDEAGGASSVRFSPDGKTVYFTEADGTLYSIAVSALKKGDKPERISRSVGSFSMLKDGRLLYTEQGSGEERLNIYEKGESFRLLKGYSDYQLSEDQKTIYYTEQDGSDGTVALYKMAITKDAKEERLLKGATTIYTRYSSDPLVYGVDENAGYDSYGTPSSGRNGNTLTVYSCKPGGDKTKLVDDVYSISGVSVDGGKVSFYYYVEDVEERTLYDFVTDTNAGSDAATLSGLAPVSPSWSDYSPRNYGIEADGITVYYTDRAGTHYTIPASVISDILSGSGRTVSDLRTWELSSYANDDARERYNSDLEDYNARREVWNEAQSRDYIRQSLKDSPYNQTSYSLYHYTGTGTGEAIATGINSNSRVSSPSNGVFLYHKVSLEGGKVADISDLGYAGEIYDLLYSGDTDEDWYQNVGGKESVIDLDDVTSINGIYVLNGKEVVLSVYDGYDRSLRAFTLNKESLTFSSTIVEDDFTGPYLRKASDKDVLHLFTDTAMENNNHVGDFCIYKDGKLETVAKDVYYVMVLDDSGAVYAVTDIDSRGNREVAVMKDGTPTTISDEFDSGYNPIFLDGSQLLYISDGDLVLWNGKESRTIARDVERAWASVQEDYTICSAG